MAQQRQNVTQARLFTSLIVITLCLFVTAVLLLRDITADNWQEELLTFYFPIFVLPATCIYLITLAIRVHNLEQQVAIINSYDPLTHTLKSTTLLEQAKKIYQGTDLAKEPISILCMEVDRVEAIVEEYGQEAADAVLREFGGTIIGATREKDLIGRLGEDSFIAVVLNTPSDYTLPVVARFQELAHADVVLNDDKEVRYSISVGFASSDQTEAPAKFDTLLERAKSALENAKKEGPASVQGWIT
ncbi:MAG: GGDEF domain-containing protein [Porticoccaceae bacterium]